MIAVSDQCTYFEQEKLIALNEHEQSLTGERDHQTSNRNFLTLIFRKRVSRRHSDVDRVLMLKSNWK